MNPKYLYPLIALFLILNVTVSYGQETELEPKITEVWEPQPVKITPGKNNAPPSDAIILFDGTNLNEWESTTEEGPAKWKVENGAMTVVAGTGPIKTKKSFGDVQLHIEWRAPSEIVGEGQGRGNSGVFLQRLYEVQVLDSYESKTYANGQAGSIYKQHIPLVNANLAPGEWQTYDIIFQAPLFKENGDLGRPAAVTVIHNGVVVQNHVILKGPTEYIGFPKYRKHDYKQPLELQDHGNPVSYRNIWIREL